MELIIFFIISVMMIVISIGMLKSRQNCKMWIEEQFKKYDISSNSTKFILHGVDGYNLMTYTNENILYVFNGGIRAMEVIKLSDILSVETEIFSSEKNVKKLISLTSTYDKRVKIAEARFKITTHKDVYIVQYIPGRNILDTQLLKNIENKINQINRCKLILEYDIKKIKEKNL
ncbi:MAG: hypothetical protein ACRCX8_03765 [Sarcina sp.]